MTIRPTRREFLALAAAAGTLPVFARAADAPYPSRAVQFTVPYSPGSGPDTLARAIASRLQQRFGQPFVIQNRDGASGNIGCDMVAKSAPDGGTIGIVVNNFAITPSLYKLPYDPVKDFAPIAMVARGAMVMVVRPDSPVKSLRDLMEFSKRQPGKTTYGTPGVGTPQHLAMATLENAYGVQMLHVPYKNAAQVVTGVIGGEVDCVYLPVHTAHKYLEAGRLRALAVSTSQRNDFLPDVPSMAEAGVPNVECDLWYAMLAPAHTPEPIVGQLSAAVEQILQQPDIVKTFADQGLKPVYLPPAEFSKFLRSELDRWAALVKKANISIVDAA